MSIDLTDPAALDRLARWHDIEADCADNRVFVDMHEAAAALARAEAERLRAPAELEPESLINAERARGDALEALLIEAQDELVRLRAPAPDVEAARKGLEALYQLALQTDAEAAPYHYEAALGPSPLGVDEAMDEVTVALTLASSRIFAAIRALAGTP